MGGSNSKPEAIPKNKQFQPHLQSIPIVIPPSPAVKVQSKLPSSELRPVPKVQNLQKIKVGKCVRCLQSRFGYRLGCDHEICSNCLVSYVYLRSYNTLQGNVKCPECPVVFDCEPFFKKFEGEKEEIKENSNELKHSSHDKLKLAEDQPVRKSARSRPEEQNLRGRNSAKDSGDRKSASSRPEEPAMKVRSSAGDSKSIKKCQNKRCNSQVLLLELNCGDIYCKNCIKSEALKQTNGTLADRIRCPRCNQFILSSFIDKAFGGSDTVKRIIEKASEDAIKKLLDQEELLRQKPKFKCELCYSVTNVEEGITLDCEHRFCESCIKGYIEFKISNNEVKDDQMVCPQCQQSEIQQPIIKAMASPELYLKYENFTILNIRPSNPKEIKKSCPFCETVYYIAKKAKEITCISCKKTYCPQCNQSHKLITCEDYAKIQDQKQEKKKEVEEIEKLKQDLGEYAICPCCKEGVVLDKGCRFMKCRWPQCPRKPFFCFICEKELRKNQHYSHFKKNGPFGKTCNTVDNVEES